MMDSARERAMILFLSWLLSSKSHLIRIRVRALAQRISVRTIVHKTPAKSGFWVLSRNQSSKTTISKYHSRGRRIDVSSSTSSISSCCVVNFATSLMCNGASVTAIGPRLIVVSSVSKVERRFRHLMPRSVGVGFWNKNNIQVFTIKLRLCYPFTDLTISKAGFLSSRLDSPSDCWNRRERCSASEWHHYSRIWTGPIQTWHSALIPYWRCPLGRQYYRRGN